MNPNIEVCPLCMGAKQVTGDYVGHAGSEKSFVITCIECKGAGYVPTKAA